VVRRAVECGVQFIDTADSYGPHISEQIIRKAIYPYREDILIATKAGLTRNGPDIIETAEGIVRLGPKAWPPLGRPEYLRQQVMMSMRRLGVEYIDLLQLHRVDPSVPFDDQIGELKLLQQEGKVRLVGLSQVSVEQIERARVIVDIASVQNRFNLTDRSSDDVLEYCTVNEIVFIPWAPMAAGKFTGALEALERVAANHGSTTGQIALAWLLALRPQILPIPGTSRRDHLEENLASAAIRLDQEEMRTLELTRSQ
jgi:aryl-alcohol dehydrogenase-like predicted oxidoreductase